MDVFPFIPARWFTPASRTTIDLVVFHDMEAPESMTTAENVAYYFKTTPTKVSSHYCIDADTIVQCVDLEDVAWCAPGANHNGIHLEHAGYAKQTRAEWLDPYSTAMMQLSAKLTAALCEKYGIPVKFCNATDLKNGKRGITTHAEVTLAYRRSTHTDPGPNWPRAQYIAWVQQATAELATAPARKPWPIPVPAWFWGWARWYLAGRQGPRPADAPLPIPDWAWRRLEALVAGRVKRVTDA
jgi:N-acetyl-anhydromuramyl-L-alanine amidase AmpD